MKIERILFPTDLSDGSITAADFALDVAESSHSELHILYVNDPRDVVAMAVYSCPSLVASSAEVELKKEMERLKQSLIKLPCRYHYVTGEPAHEICRLAKNESIDLIVMSSHGRSGTSRLLLGSVAERVMRNAHCPVLIVKQPTHDASTDSVPNKFTSTGCEES